MLSNSFLNFFNTNLQISELILVQTLFQQILTKKTLSRFKFYFIIPSKISRVRFLFDYSDRKIEKKNIPVSEYEFNFSKNEKMIA